MCIYIYTHICLHMCMYTHTKISYLYVSFIVCRSSWFYIILNLGSMLKEQFLLVILLASCQKEKRERVRQTCSGSESLPLKNDTYHSYSHSICKSSGSTKPKVKRVGSIIFPQGGTHKERKSRKLDLKTLFIGFM